MASTSIVAGALRCSLGVETETVARDLQAGKGTADLLTLNDFPGQAYPYFAMPDLAVNGEDDEALRERQALENCVAELLNSAALEPGLRDEVGVFLGSSSYTIGAAEQRYRRTLTEDSASIPLQQTHYGDIARHLSQRFGLGGGEYTFSTACTSSANALLYALQAVQSGRMPAALVVGVEFFNRTTLLGFDSLQLLARDGYYPFDLRRSGMVLGEGIGAVVVADRDRLPLQTPWRGVTIRGGANGCDPNGLTCSSAASMARIMAQALERSGLTPAQLALIKGHGSGSLSNDAVESTAMRQLFGHDMPALTSLKGALGHTLGACGVLELVALIGSLQHGHIPPTKGFARIDPECGCTPLTCSTPFHGGAVMLNYFGFGGNNTSLILEVD